MKTIQVRFVVEGDEVIYSCLYLEKNLRGGASYRKGSVNVESCCCPEIVMSDDDTSIFLRGSAGERDEEESHSDRVPFLEMLPDILEALLGFDEKYKKPSYEEKKSEVIINGETFSFDTEEQKQIIKLLRIKI